MSFEIIQEGGPLKAKKTGPDQYSMSVSLPEDKDGRVARECPNQECSPGYFKVKFGTGVTGKQTVAYCPYCQKAAEPSDFHTKEQIRYAKDLVMREAKIGAERAVREALGFGSGGKRRLVDGLIKVDMEMKSDPPEHVWQPYEDILQRDLICPHCTLDHSVYGFAIWCPDCGKDIFTTHVRGEIRVIEAIVGDVDRRKNELGARVAARDLENALEDLVSIFEATFKIEIRRYRKDKGDSDGGIDATMKKIGSRLQSVSSAVTIVSESCDGIPLFPAGSNDEGKLARVFQKRHPITHNLGVVDRKYIDKVRSEVASN
jgi:ribosomal protein L44E